MAASPTPALNAVTTQLAAALEEYAQDVVRLMDSSEDLELYHAVSAKLDEIRMYSNAVPEVREQWIELLVTHAELVHCFWRVQYGHEPRPSPDWVRAREHHADALRALRARTLRVIAWNKRQAG